MQIAKFPYGSLLGATSIACAVFSLCAAYSGQRHASASAPEATIEGRVLSCWQGQVTPWKGIEVRIYTMGQSKEIRALLKEWRTLPNDNTPASMQRITSTMDRLERAVRHTPMLLPATKTNSGGRFWFRHVPQEASYLILATELESEEGASFLDHEIIELKHDVESFAMVFGADSEEHCKPPATKN